jgi:hypothetical protein
MAEANASASGYDSTAIEEVPQAMGVVDISLPSLSMTRLPFEGVVGAERRIGRRSPKREIGTKPLKAYRPLKREKRGAHKEKQLLEEKKRRGMSQREGRKRARERFPNHIQGTCT